MPKASCRNCADLTGKLEGYVARRVFQDVRVEHGYPYRDPATRPVALPLCETFAPSPEKAPTRLVPVRDYPGMLVLLNHQPAGILQGRDPNAGSHGVPFVRQITGDERVKSLEARGIRALHYRELQPDLFARFIAKVALGVAVAVYGLDGFLNAVSDVILRRDTNPYHWVGGTTPGMSEFPPPSGAMVLHRVLAYRRDLGDVPHLLVQLQLCTHLDAPFYTVVVGKMTAEGVEQSERWPHLARALPWSVAPAYLPSGASLNWDPFSLARGD